MAGIKIVNCTEYDTAEVRRLTRAVLKDAECTDVCVHIIHRRNRMSNHTGGQYRSYWWPSKGEDRPQILVSLPRPGVKIESYHPYQRRDAPEVMPLNDWREALVAVLAHEAEHHRQSRKRGRQRRMVEVECDWAAHRALRRYREAAGVQA